MLEKVKEGIYRICIPFENIYTSIFIITDEKRAIILDSGSCFEDVRKYVLPGIEELKVKPTYLVSSHSHKEHCGGMQELRFQFPDAKYLSFASETIEDDEILLSRFRLLNLKGHTDDCLGIFDLETGVLLSGDSLQVCGVGKYGVDIDDYVLYLSSINRLRKLRIRTIIASHDFVPCGFMAEGEEVDNYLYKSEMIVREIIEFIERNVALTPAEVAELFNFTHPGIPPITERTIGNIRKLRYRMRR